LAARIASGLLPAMSRATWAEPTAPLETLWFGLARDLRKNQGESEGGTAGPAAQM